MSLAGSPRASFVGGSSIFICGLRAVMHWLPDLVDIGGFEVLELGSIVSYSPGRDGRPKLLCRSWSILSSSYWLPLRSRFPPSFASSSYLGFWWVAYLLLVFSSCLLLSSIVSLLEFLAVYLPLPFVSDYCCSSSFWRFDCYFLCDINFDEYWLSGE